jgi:histidinol-phosphate/aromatic aminotransferase/cobyric acid decarboxylase-like protein
LNANNVQLRLAEDFRIVIRDRSSQPLLTNCLRISVGTNEQNDQLLNALTQLTR